MKVSLTWIKKYTDLNFETDELVAKIGSQLGAVDDVLNVGKMYEGLVFVKVVHCQKHPDADKLSVCLVDDNTKIGGVKRDDNGLIQIVCGAPNVAPGQTVVWIPPGAYVPVSFEKEPFQINSRKIRGVESHGMIASSHELAIGDDHQGILVIDKDVPPGMSFKDEFSFNDTVIDIENKMFTHRPDCFGMLGVAREIAGIYNHPFKSPAWYDSHIALPRPADNSLKLNIDNQIPDLVPRFVAAAIKNVEVKPSPMWLQTYLSRVGAKPINNVVDITNYIMLETGQPLHAYDYDKLLKLDGETGEVNLVVRLAKPGENLTLLDGKMIKLQDGTMVVATSEVAVGLGGVKGGADSQVDESSKNIVLECATWDVSSIRKAAMQYGQFTDAAIRYMKRPSPLQNLAVLARAIDKIEKLAGGKLACEVIDVKNDDKLKPNTAVSVTSEFINSRLGLNLSEPAMQRLLENVEFKVNLASNTLTIEPPFWRTDIEIAEDIIEEIGRLQGYDNLTLSLPQRNLTPAPPNQDLAFKQLIRAKMSQFGGNELLTYSFIHDSLLEKAGQSSSRAYAIRNAISPDLKHYRISLLPSLLEKIYANVRAGFDDFMIYELGSAHMKGVLDEDDLPKAMSRFAFVTAASDKLARSGAPYYQAKYIFELLAEKINISNLKLIGLSGGNSLSRDWLETAAPFEIERSALIYSGDQLLGVIGEPNQSVKTLLKLPRFTAMAEFDTWALRQNAKRLGNYSPLDKFPNTYQDICLRVKAELTYDQVLNELKASINKTAAGHGYKYKISPVDIFQHEDDKIHKQITWRIELSHPLRTLTTEEANKLLDETSEDVQRSIGAVRI